MNGRLRHDGEADVDEGFLKLSHDSDNNPVLSSGSTLDPATLTTVTPGDPRLQHQHLSPDAAYQSSSEDENTEYDSFLNRGSNGTSGSHHNHHQQQPVILTSQQIRRRRQEAKGREAYTRLPHACLRPCRQA